MSQPVHFPVPAAQLEPWPLASEQVVAGQPAAYGLVLHEGENGAGCGIWECSPGTFDWAYDVHQSLCLVSGEADVQIKDGPRLSLKPGDAVLFPAGTMARWTVKATVRKLYTLYR
jgi:uncharacterized cupin superfamily protein